MIGWSFVARDGSGTERVIDFYARTEREATKLAASWAGRTGNHVERVDQRPTKATR